MSDTTVVAGEKRKNVSGKVFADAFKVALQKHSTDKNVDVYGEVAAITGLKRLSVVQRANTMRKAGIKLPDAPRVSSVRVSADDLNAYLTELGIAKVETVEKTETETPAQS